MENENSAAFIEYNQPLLGNSLGVHRGLQAAFRSGFTSVIGALI